MDECIINMDTSEGIIKSQDIDPVRIKNTIDYGIPLDCMWIVTVETNKKVRSFIIIVFELCILQWYFFTDFSDIQQLQSL